MPNSAVFAFLAGRCTFHGNQRARGVRCDPQPVSWWPLSVSHLGMAAWFAIGEKFQADHITAKKNPKIRRFCVLGRQMPFSGTFPVALYSLEKCQQNNPNAPKRPWDHRRCTAGILRVEWSVEMWRGAFFAADARFLRRSLVQFSQRSLRQIRHGVPQFYDSERKRDAASLAGYL